MKNFITIGLLFLCSFSYGQNARVVPVQNNVCENTQITAEVSGQSFFVTSYQWNTGATTASITIQSSGTYTCTISGLKANGRPGVYTASRTYNILARPSINVVQGPYVCRFDTVKLSVSPGYNSYTWNNGFVGTDYVRAMDSIYGTPTLDTASVWFTARIANVCTVNSDTIVIRGVRAPNGVGQFYCGTTAGMNLDINDSIPAGLVLEYIYPVQYEMEFTQVSDPTNVITYFPPLGSRNAPANILTPGENYYVRTRVIINGQTFCWGSICEIGLTAPMKATPIFGYDPPPVDSLDSSNDYIRVVEVLPNYFIIVTPKGKYIKTEN